MSENPHNYINEKIEKAEKEIQNHIDRIAKKNSLEGLSIVDRSKTELKMLESLFSYLHKKLKKLNKELESEE
tara:strand:+ start:450 stop:665 length:216 start_codon:yes stop_codon:yes gene_type:complete